MSNIEADKKRILASTAHPNCRKSRRQRIRAALCRRIAPTMGIPPESLNSSPGLACMMIVRLAGRADHRPGGRCS